MFLDESFCDYIDLHLPLALCPVCCLRSVFYPRRRPVCDDCHARRSPCLSEALVFEVWKSHLEVMRAEIRIMEISRERWKCVLCECSLWSRPVFAFARSDRLLSGSYCGACHSWMKTNVVPALGPWSGPSIPFLGYVRRPPWVTL